VTKKVVGVFVRFSCRRIPSFLHRHNSDHHVQAATRFVNGCFLKRQSCHRARAEDFNFSARLRVLMGLQRRVVFFKDQRLWSNLQAKEFVDFELCRLN
jgi:hypothetical protein